MDPKFNGEYHPLFSNNARLVDSTQVNLDSQVPYALDNLFVFGLQDIFVFKDIAPFEVNKFDWYEDRDYIRISESFNEYLRSKTSRFVVQNEFGDFTKFGYVDQDKFDYFLYNPKSIDITTVEEFTEGNISPQEIPVLLDANNLSSLLISPTNNISNPNKLEYKFSKTNPTVYYIKINTGENPGSILLQFNQSFHPRWKLFESSKSEWESKDCVDEMNTHDLTRNSSCRIESSVTGFDTLLIPFRNTVPLGAHLKGNFVGNLYKIEEDSIQQDRYYVLYFEKQSYYSFLLFTTLTILCLLLFFALNKRLKVI